MSVTQVFFSKVGTDGSLMSYYIDDRFLPVKYLFNAYSNNSNLEQQEALRHFWSLLLLSTSYLKILTFPLKVPWTLSSLKTPLMLYLM